MKLRHGTPEEVDMSAERIQHAVDLAEGWVAEGITPALVILAARRGVMVMHEAFGGLRPETDSPLLKLDTIFPLASLSKPVTATAAMTLVELGLLGLNRPVSEYIPEFVGEGKDAVMVHHLLTHTSGLNNQEVNAHREGKKGTVEIPPPDDTQDPDTQEYLFLGYDAPLWKPPGTVMLYCNYGYNLVGEIIRRISGRSLDDYAKERIFNPLGMRDTSYILSDSLRHRMVGRPEDMGASTGLLLRATEEIVPWAGSGGVLSTAMDIGIFGQMFLNRGAYGDARILSPPSVAEMTRNQLPGIGSQYGDEFFPEALWGLGWNIRGAKKRVAYGETLQSPETFSHGGSGGVFLWVDPVYELVGVFFSVALQPAPRHYYPCDLFINAVTAAVVDI